MEERIMEILSDSTVLSLTAKDSRVEVEIQLYTEELITVIFSNVKAFVALEVWGLNQDIGELIVVDKSILLEETISKLTKDGEKDNESIVSYQFKDSVEETVLEIIASKVEFIKH